MDIDFKEIKPFSRGGQHAAFEELCCQLARRAKQPRPFVRLRGDGGDGGIEGYVELPEGKRGWQAKCVFDPSRLVKQASKSFRTALKNHSDLSSFVLCFPFDLTGRTGRGKGGIQKLEEWRESQFHYAKEIGRDIEIKFWSASELRALLIEHDVSGGLRRFFFDGQILTNQWFKGHLDQVRATAGPRYTPELNVSTDIWTWFAAFGGTIAWSNALSTRLRSLRKKLHYLRLSNTDPGKQAEKAAGNSLGGTWPNGTAQRVATQVATIKEVVAALQRAKDLSKQEYSELNASLRSAADDLRDVGEELALDINRQHGEGAADSPGWRQHMAEWMGSLPAENLDSTRSVVDALDALDDWLASPAFALAFETSFVLTGEAGSGKTHSVCDIAHQRHQEGLRTCLLFGHEFCGQSDPWVRIAETLGLTGLGRDQLLDALDSAGEASGFPLLVCIDAINETRPLDYWRNRLMALLSAVSSRRFLRVCIVCRTPFAPVCLPEQNKLAQFEHRGFSGRRRDAYRFYCAHYGLRPPSMPVLQREMDNPLYLRLLCETARDLGWRSLAPDWSGSVIVIGAFLDQKEERFAEEHQVPSHANFMRKTLMALVEHLVTHAATDVSWSDAINAVLKRISGVDREQAARYFEWLVREGLLIDDAPHASYSDTEGTLRPAFERLGDFLVADAILRNNTDPPPDLTRWIGTVQDIERHRGMLGVLSVLLAERKHLELPDLTVDSDRSTALLGLTLDALPSRPASAFTDRSEVLVRQALSLQGISYRAMEGLVAIAWRTSPLDAHWLHDLLRSIPLAQRDAYWCDFLHEGFSKDRVVGELIREALDAPLDELDAATAERWAVLLLWFTAAADRRVKDGATRAAVAVLAEQPTILPTVLETMMSIDDDAVRERALLSAYGALLRTRHLDALRGVAIMLHRLYEADVSAFSNALIRDHIRAICELAAHLDVLEGDVDPKFSNKVRRVKGEDWPLPLPSADDVEAWSQSIGFWPDEFRSDFFKYSMWCMKPWEGGMSREDMTKWMLQTIAKDFQFVGSNCEAYDQRMLHEHGGGREKPVWAERIGKKYTWIAMHQLASRLHDNVLPTHDGWEPVPIRTPFILADSRQLDPSLSLQNEGGDAREYFATSQPNTMKSLDDITWLALEEDVPIASQLIETQSIDDQDWRPLVAHLSSGRPDDYDYDSPYRQIWLRLFGYLVRPKHAARIFKELQGRNFSGGWMPEGRLGSDGGFAAEYPWATSFNSMPDEWYSLAFDDRVSKVLVPAWNDLSCGWEYDASFEGTNTSINMHVPARLFFGGDDLWWDGRGGYRRNNGVTVFFDPSCASKGPSALLADAGYLASRLQALDWCLMWTLLGCKQMLGGSMRDFERTPMRMFSQVAWMDTEGKIQEGALTFFDDPNDKKGLA